MQPTEVFFLEWGCTARSPGLETGQGQEEEKKEF
jgi:hypothetical protein